ncbi:aldehyde ferredoxin oxidoreductase family protein [Candidatus Solincola tengchongensis]|uniref:aldehyde ferredoxin oxidoreductase family protein n=1 Tax=Candidatus Solincola tengchongensis TaxID=2900693 RepID=UPI00257F8108|nr:aldehyde ferredoxin oxidoreductase family protein [Candidatus Solincola tengchongensis]
MKGYAGKYLRIDLGTGEIKRERLPEEVARAFIGGYGLVAWTLYNEVPDGADPLSPENVLCLWTGPVAGTLVPVSSKYIVGARSPATGFIGFGIASGGVGSELKAAGWDGIVITGKASRPTYVLVQNDKVELRDASRLWGKTTWETEELIREELRDDEVRVSAIGPAGELLSCLANITNDRNRQVGRSGMGAVMGSKNLKAIAVRGTGNVEVAHLEELLEYCRDLYQRCRGPATEKYRILGTPANVLVHNRLGCLPSYNFQKGTFEQAEAVSGETMLKTMVKKIVACPACPIACDHINLVKEGPWAGTVASMDYESLELLGPNCGVADLNAITKAVELCDTLGVDTISAGVTVSWAMEAYEKGLLTGEDVDGLDLRFGNGEAMVEAVRRLCLREGRLGELLADGAARAAEKVGKDSHKFAMVNKKLEWGAYSLRSLQTATLGFATSLRGACYLRSGSYQVDVKGQVDRYHLDRSRGKIVFDGENLYAIIDSLIICKFTRGIYKDNDELAKVIRLVTGFDMDAEEMIKAGERIHNMAKLFNVRFGASRKDDYPPPRAFEEKMYDDVNNGAIIDRAEYEEALSGYYECRGWNEEGIPTKAKLEELGLDTTLGV